MPRSVDLAQESVWEHLIEAAWSARERAYCPYSHYSVGSALQDDRGQIFLGANIENISFGATICAERSAVCSMVAAGGTSVAKIVVATSDGAFPCGVCLQVLLEFNRSQAKDLEVGIASPKQIQLYSFSELLPFAFSTFHNASVLKDAQR